MAVIDFLMPKMGESVMEGSIIKWFKGVGDTVELDETILEIGTDKVDTEIPSPHHGKLIEILVTEGEVAQIGQPIAKFETDAEGVEEKTFSSKPEPEIVEQKEAVIVEQPVTAGKEGNNGFFSPLVLNIAKKEGVGFDELTQVSGSGKEGRVTKKDILTYVQNRSSRPVEAPKTTVIPNIEENTQVTVPVVKETLPVEPATSSFSGEVEIQQMSRMRKIISERMLESQRVSATVSSFVEADVTNLVYWRNRWKQHFKEKEKAVLTLTPIFIEAVIKALKDYPMMNVSVVGDTIHVKKDINIGLAVALPDGNLVVPVIKNADQYNLVGLTKKMNDLAKRARTGNLDPDELKDGTYTVSNVGSFGNVMGTPILVQPQVGILALGTVTKKPAIIDTPQGDAIAIRHMMFLSHSYDHRVVDGSLGGMFVRRVADYLGRYDLDRTL